jgi:sugar/nucleoside kinase (ribokinase family)
LKIYFGFLEKMKFKDIQLCGLGNGLVDLLYEVEYGLIDRLGLKKGEMRLVDKDLQSQLLKHLEGKPHHRCSGGSAANTIIAFTQFGGRSAYKTVLGSDEFGYFYASEFHSLGINLLAPHIDEPTGTCIVLVTPDSERTMNTSLGATAHFGIEHISSEFIERSQWIYLEGYKFSAKSSTEALFYAIDLAQKFNTKVALTVSDVAIVTNFFDDVMKAIMNSDLLFCNENEAKALTESHSVVEAVSKLKKLIKNFVVTCGDKGSYVVFGEKEIDIPSYKATPIDTTGAGDMYAGGFMFGLINFNNIEFAGHLGSLAASKVVSQFGARLSGTFKEMLFTVSERFTK